MHIRGTFHIRTNFTRLCRNVFTIIKRRTPFFVTRYTRARQPFVAVVKSIKTRFSTVCCEQMIRTFIDRPDVETRVIGVTLTLLFGCWPLVFFFLSSRIKPTCNTLCPMDNRRPRDAETGCRCPCTRPRSGGNGFCVPISLWTRKLITYFYAQNYQIFEENLINYM